MSSYGQLWSARIQLMRLPNAVMAAVGVMLGAWLMVPNAGVIVAVPAAIAALCITSFGNILNDVRDVELDRSAHPDRPLPAGVIKVNEAKLFAGLLLAFGLWEAALAAGQRTLWFAVVNVGLLLLYEWRLKRLGLPGNVTVGLLVASTFLFGAITVTADWRSMALPIALAAMAFLANVAREILKDVQDAGSDAMARTTLPMQIGTAGAVLLAFVLVQVAIVLSAVTWWQATWSLWWGIPLLVANGLFLVASAGAWLNVRLAQQGLKAAMFIAMVAFAVGPIL